MGASRKYFAIPRSIKSVGFLLSAMISTFLVVAIVQAALTFTGTTIESDGVLSVIFEGATANDFETTLAAADPTADRTVTFPDAAGTVVLDTATQTLTNKTLITPTIASILNGVATLTLPLITGTVLATTGEAQGDILYHNGTAWTKLAAGTNGQYFQTQGAGANPQWATVSSTGIANVVEDTTPQLGGMLDVNGFALGDGTLELLKFTETASAVNEITVTNAATGNKPVIAATGDNAAVGLDIQTKGAADLLLTPGAATSTVNIVTGNLKVGDGSNGVALDGEDAYVEGTLEVDGTSQFDSSITLGAGAKITPFGATNHGPVFALYNTITNANTTNKTMGVIPANANIIEITLFVATSFNDSGTDFLDCGTTVGDPVEYLNAADVSGAGAFRIGSGGAAASTVGDVGGSNVTVLCKYRGANGNSSAGAGTLVILYMID